MFTPVDQLYYGLLLTGMAHALYWVAKGDKRSVFLLILFTATFLFEVLMKCLAAWKLTGYKFLFDVFSATEYLLYCLYYLQAPLINKTRPWVKVSAMLFIVVSLVFAWLTYKNEIRNAQLITGNIAIEGTLLVVVYSHLLFRIDDNVPLPIYKHPDFWVSVGVLIFNSGVFVIFVFYPLILSFSKVQAVTSYAFFLGPLNLIQYACINIRFICLHQKKLFIQ